MSKIHPEKALYQEAKPLPIVSPCDHYAGSEKFIQKALSLQRDSRGSFDLTCDLEDGAPTGAEVAHLKAITALIAGLKNHPGAVGVRVHPFRHRAFKLEIKTIFATVGRKISHLTVPKIESLNEAKAVMQALSWAAKAAKLKIPPPVHLLIETHGAVREVWEIAKLPYLRGLDFGIMDFISAHGGAIPAEATRSPGQFEHKLIVRAKVELAAAALAQSILPVHNVTTDFKWPKQVLADARRARQELGFLRMWSIHPDQIDPILKAMTPDRAELAQAGELLLCAQQKAWAPIEFEGRLHDRASYRYYWYLLKQAARAGIGLETRIKKNFSI